MTRTTTVLPPIARRRIVALLRLACLPFALVTLAGEPSLGMDADPLMRSINQVKSSNVAERTVGAKYLIDNWDKSLQPVIREIGKMEAIASSPKQGSIDVVAMVGLTDVLRTILANRQKEDAVGRFRKLDDDPKTIQALAWMARNDNRDLRFNSTFILASVLDNSNVCVVLDHLRDPRIDPNGRINLLQTVQPVANFAYKENAELIEKTLPITMKNAADSKGIGAIVEELNQRVKKSQNASKPLASDNIALRCPSPGIAPLR